MLGIRLLIASLAVTLGSCKTATKSAPDSVSLDPAALRSSFFALPARFDSPAHPSSGPLVALGRMLYFEPRLSKNQDRSCNTCHDLATGGVDHARVSTGHKGQLGTRNSPTVLNAAGQNSQFWDGRAADVEAQATGPILNPVEMAMVDEAAVVRVLASMPAYVDAFAAAFPGDPQPITLAHVGQAIGAFERGLVTPSRWDAFLAGNNDAISAAEFHGGGVFLSSGCTACHDRTLLGGMSLSRLGVVQPYPTTDLGRGAYTHDHNDDFFFKVPMLRNVVQTGPYFHDGSISDLPTAVRTMARIQLGRTLSDADVDAIVTFLRVLDAAPAADYAAPPVLPPSGPDTPAPDPS